MFKRYSTTFDILRPITDVAFHAIAFISASYYSGERIDFVSNIFWYQISLITVIYTVSYKYYHLYWIQRDESLLVVDLNILKASTMAILVFNIACLMARLPIRPKEIILFYIIDLLYLITYRMLLIAFLHSLRRKGYNLRHVIIAGAGTVGKQLCEKIELLGWTGFKVMGFLDDNLPKGAQVLHHTVLGTIDEVGEMIKRYGADQIFVCLPMKAYKRIEELLEAIDEELVTVRIVPDIYQYPLLLKSSVGMLGDIPIITLNDTLFHGWRRLFKRAFDIAFSLGVLLLVSPVMIAIAIGVKLSSPGPFFYRQERMGLDGKSFRILKFRSMPVDAEKQSGPVWAKAGEKRATGFGAFLRQTSLDELPQFINVLMGSMSVVGPRPERPVFISKFKKEVPKYMLRHLMKAGITGWAQVNGWRGNTSIEKRIEHDIYYIENWSLLLDFKIIFLTLLKGFASKNAY